jgi:phosphatidylglycerophosphatase A
MKFFSKAFSTFFGAGYFPIAPGTFASLIVALLYKFFLAQWEWGLYARLWLVVFFAGLVSSTLFSRELRQKDPGKIVIDEVSGQMIALFLIPPSWLPILLSFFLFRLFDVVKPYPIRKLERLEDGLGIMADDVLAGLYAGVLVHLYLIIK